MLNDDTHSASPDTQAEPMATPSPMLNDDTHSASPDTQAEPMATPSPSLGARRSARSMQVWMDDAERAVHGMPGRAEFARMVGQRLQVAMDANRIRGQELAKRIGHSNGAQITLWRNGERLPPLTALTVIAVELGVSMDWLVGLAEDEAVDPRIQRRREAMQQSLATIHAVAALVADVAGDLAEAETDAELAWRSLRSDFAELAQVLMMVRERNAVMFDGQLVGGARLLAIIERLQASVARMEQQPRRPEALRSQIRAMRAAIASQDTSED